MTKIAVSYGMRRVFTLLALSLAAFSSAQFDTGASRPAVTATNPALSSDQKTSVLKGLNDIITQKAFIPNVDFAKWPSYISAKQSDIDKAEDVNAFSRIINDSLREFGLSHLRLQTPRSAVRRTQISSTGAGAVVTKNDQGFTVRNVIDGSPAKEVGIESGDVIVSVNGKKADDPGILEGVEGTQIKMEVKKASGEVKPVEVTFKKFSTIRPETLTWVGTDTAILKVFTFSAGYGRENLEKLVAEANTKAKYLIVDVRSNGGGAVNNLNHLLSMLMPDRTTYGVFVSRKLVDDFKTSNPDAAITTEAVAKWAPNKVATRQRTVIPFKGKIVVLTNRGTGSASEILAESLRENVGAKIVGAKSAGAVLASVFGRLPEGFAIQYPVSDFISSNGVRLEKNPLVPDFEITELPKDGKDPVIDKAVELVRSM